MWKALNTICYSIEAYRQLSNVTKFVSYTFKAVKYNIFFLLKKLLFLQSRKVHNRNTIVLILNQNEEKMIQFKFLNARVIRKERKLLKFLLVFCCAHFILIFS
jgi:hypothetical protein